MTTIRHGGPPALRTRMKSAERGSKSVVFLATKDRMVFATGLEGGGRIPAQDVAKPLSAICLISLWLSFMNRPSRFGRGRTAGTRATPPKKPGGHADTDSWHLWHASIRSYGGSLSSSFIPAGRLGTAPHKLVFSRGWARRWAPSGPGELSSSLRPRCSRPADATNTH